MKRVSQRRQAGPVIWAGRLIAGFLVLLLFSLVLLWLLRKPIAERALQAWCDDRDLTCEAKFTRISSDGATLSGVRISSGGAVPAEASEVRARISWPSLFVPRIDGIAVSGLEMRGTLDPSGLKFHGLERLAAPGSGTAGPAPPIEIRDARIYLATPFGPAAATLNMSGRVPVDASLSLEIDPARLASGEARLSLSEARLSAVIKDGRVTSDLRLGVEEAAAEGFSASGFSLAAEAGFPYGSEGAAELEWSARLASATSAQGSFTGLRTRGQAEFDTLPDVNAGNLLDALTLAVAQLEADSLDLAGWSSGPAAFNAEIEGRNGTLQGPLALEAARLSGPAGSAAQLRLAGDIQRAPGGAAAFTGGVQLNEAALTPETLQPVLASLDLPADFSAHGEALSGALRRAARDFDTAFGLKVHQSAAGLVVEADGPSGLAAASGLRLEASRAEGGSWLTVRAGEVRLSGDLSLSGGGAPDLSAKIGAARLTSERAELADTSVNLAPWTAGGRTVAARLNAFNLELSADEFTAAGQGSATFTGELGGVSLARTTLSGGLNALHDAAGWRVQSEGGPCLGFLSEGIAMSGIAVSRAAFDICPVDGRFIRQGGPIGGATRLGDIALPVSFSGGTGTLDLSGAMADWSLDDGFSLLIRADTLSMPMILGERTLGIASGDPEIRIATRSGPAQVAARLGQTQFDGSLIPANVSARLFRFDGTSTPGGLAGEVAAERVRIADIRKDEIYEPVLADFTGRIDGQRLVASGPVRLEASGKQIGSASADINIFDLDGTANMTSLPLVFLPGGMQPAMISDRLTGLFTDASGEFSGIADFTIARGNIQGTADLAVTNFGFQTTRLGRVEGVSGRVRFDDVMGLTTAPGQEITIANLNPGIPLSSGRVVFDLSDGHLLHLDSVTFPFAGGQLALAPMDWSLRGGEQRVEVTAKEIDLTRLIEVLKLPDTSAQGTVSGVFPIEFTPSSVVIRDARLKADEGGGRLSYTGGAVNSAAENDPTAAMAFNALRDLEYSVLEVGLSGDLAGRVQAEILLSGQNVRSVPLGGLTMPAGQAFEFRMGFNLPLAGLIQENLKATDTRALIDIATGREPLPEDTSE